MAIGDVYTNIESIAAGAYLDIQPASGYEATIHNIYHANNVAISRFDGTNTITFETITGAGVFAYQAFHVTNTDRIRVINNASLAALIGFDGIYTKAG